MNFAPAIYIRLPIIKGILCRHVYLGQGTPRAGLSKFYAGKATEQKRGPKNMPERAAYRGAQVLTGFFMAFGAFLF